MAKEAKPWERQDNETPKQFEAFVVYRDMGEERSLSKVADKLQKSTTLMGRWSGLNSWVERVAAWDDEQERILRHEQIKEIKKMRKRHADTATAMIAAAAKGLKNIMEHPEEMKPGDVARLVEVASKLERISRGDVGDVVEQRDGGQTIEAVQLYIPENNRDKKEDTFDDLEV